MAFDICHNKEAYKLFSAQEQLSFFAIKAYGYGIVFSPTEVFVSCRSL